MIDWLVHMYQLLLQSLQKERATIPDKETDVAVDMPPKPQNSPQPSATPPAYLWDTPANVRHSVRAICDEEGLTVDQKNALSSTVHCESDYNPKAIHPNVVSGKVGSTDYGLCQINDYWHIGPGKDFPSKDFVLDNPEKCVRWMCRQWLAGNANAWVCHLKGLYENYAA
jgi:C-type lysozyme/alpha-lactalbumin family